jgi:hypothetical protein
MLHTVQPRHLRQIEHLARLRLHDRRPRQITAAPLAALRNMKQRHIRILPTLQMMTTVTLLAARLAPRPAAQRPILRRRLGIPIRGRRLGRVARVLTQPRPQLLDHPILLADPRAQRLDQRRLLIDQSVELVIAQPHCALNRTDHACNIPCKPKRSCPRRADPDSRAATGP